MNPAWDELMRRMAALEAAQHETAEILSRLQASIRRTDGLLRQLREEIDRDD